MKRKFLSTVAAVSVFTAAVACSVAARADNNGQGHGNQGGTATPIKHLVVIFNENRSFDHYFATYPNATNPKGETPFQAAHGTPRVNNLQNANLLFNNPNLNPANGAGASNPFRIDPTQVNTADQDHDYTPEQEAYDHGRADLFPLNTGSPTPNGAGVFGTTGMVMGYFDGNTTTALWNYAQHFAMNDNAYTDTYGPSTPGAIEVISGQTNGAVTPSAGASATLHEFGDAISDGRGGLTVTGDPDPFGDLCSGPNSDGTTGEVLMTSRNIGDLLNDHGISWGGFMGGFNLQTVNANGSKGCGRTSSSDIIASTNDYVPHHMWFQYYASTANPQHLRPTKPIGQSDAANHQYDLDDFVAGVTAGNFPAVSYIKQIALQDGHPGNSDPLDEQQGLVHLINFLQQQPEWSETAVIITYDDSDGWYDHAFAKPTSSSFDPTADQLDGPGVCGTKNDVPDGVAGKPVNGRCGPGTRIPFMVISPFAKQNHVGHDRISQASVVKFIEDNWLHGERIGQGSFDASAGSITDLFDFGGNAGKLFLDEETGEATSRQ